MSRSSPASRIQENLEELFIANPTSGDAYIRFQLTTEVESSPVNYAQNGTEATSQITVLLSMEQVQESLVVEAEKITPLPSMPESVIGMMTTQNRVFCVFDLAQLLKLHFHPTASRQYQVIVLQTISEKPIYIGLAVTHLQGIVRLSTENISPSGDELPSNLIPYLYGMAHLPESNKLLGTQTTETVTTKSEIPLLNWERVLETLMKLNIN